jgi:hypothetical protein
MLSHNYAPGFTLLGWLLGLIVIAIGLLNLVWVHAVPGMFYLVLSMVYLPPANGWLQSRFGLHIPAFFKIALGLAIFFFTLGVSDLGDMVDHL